MARLGRSQPQSSIRSYSRGPRLVTDSYAVPNSDVTINSWTTNTGATTNLYQAVDEQPPDTSDYIHSELA